MDNDGRPGQEHEHHKRPWRWRVGLLAVLGAMALAVTACGGGSSGPGVAGGSSSSTTTAASGSGSSGGLALAKCMRSHGVSNFPDPNSSGGIDVNGANGIDPSSPQYQAAMKSCQSLLGGGMSAAQQQQVYGAELKYSACMRTHGEPNFPDPQPPKSGPVINQNTAGQGAGGNSGPGAGVDPNSPQYISANTACQHYLPAGQGPSTNSGGGS